MSRRFTSSTTVGRYTHLTSFGDYGVRFSRYESGISSARGDAYKELFTGLSWLIYGHRFKLQTGVRLTMMDDLSDGSADYLPGERQPTGTLH